MTLLWGARLPRWPLQSPKTQACQEGEVKIGLCGWQLRPEALAALPWSRERQPGWEKRPWVSEVCKGPPLATKYPRPLTDPPPHTPSAATRLESVGRQPRVHVQAAPIYGSVIMGEMFLFPLPQLSTGAMACFLQGLCISLCTPALLHLPTHQQLSFEPGP